MHVCSMSARMALAAILLKLVHVVVDESSAGTAAVVRTSQIRAAVRDRMHAKR